jgi:predicted enzyme related to lactoylglutathione lyase
MEDGMEKAINGIGWIEISAADPDAAQRFYSGVFGWTFTPGGGEPDYRQLTTTAGEGPSGGLSNPGDAGPNFAIFCVKVADVPQALARAEELGGKALMPPITTPDGLVFAHLTDPGGNRFGIYSEPR